MTYIKTDTDHHSSISIHLPTRRTILLQRWLTPYSSRFQLTSSRRGWRQQANTQSWHWNFNSHPHEEDDGRNPSSHNDAEYFNSHPHEEDDVLHCVIGDIKNHFNSHPHEEDDPVPSVTPPFFNISTHILTKRMTCKYVSTSGIEIFQLTSSRRGWPDVFCICCLCIDISTHILTKRMTEMSTSSSLRYQSFQLTSSRRGWREVPEAQQQARAFQLTSSRRGWRRVGGDYMAYRTFQLTSSRRGWQEHTIFHHGPEVFQLTSSRRGWLYVVRKDSEHLHFNSHPHEEDDRRQEVIDYVINISTHILTKRMTLCVYTTICNIGISTHILTKRMTAILNKNNLLKIAYYISNKHFISIVDIFFHFHIYF